MVVYRDASTRDYTEIVAFLEQQHLKHSPQNVAAVLSDPLQQVVLSYDAENITGVAVLAIEEEEIDTLFVRQGNERDLPALIACLEAHCKLKGIPRLSTWTNNEAVQSALVQRHYKESEKFGSSRRYEKQL